MAKSFISFVVDDIFRASGGNFRDLAVIFPNRRAGSLFRKELTTRLSKPAWSPGVFSIDDWLNGLSGLETADHLAELALLHHVVNKEIPSVQSFSDFLDLGETLLTDFNDIDKYLVDPDKLFRVLKEIRKIDSQFDIASDPELLQRIRMFWSSFQEGRSAHQEKWLEIWNSLHAVYMGFEKSMLERGLGTSGMCYRKAAEDLLNSKIPAGRFTKFAFVGFNILTRAEETIFRNLQDAGVASFYWDYDPYYLAPHHEAGRFIRQNLADFPPPAGFTPFYPEDPDFFASSGMNNRIQVVPVSSDTGQIQTVLSDIRNRPACQRGIILSDEGLFSDLLSAWPDEMPVNFTSGYPLQDSQAAGFFQLLMAIWLDFSRSGDRQSCKSGLVLDWLRHPWSASLADIPLDPLRSLIQSRYPESLTAELLRSDAFPLQIDLAGTDTAEFLVRLEEAGHHLSETVEGISNIEKASIDLIIRQLQSMYGVSLNFGLIWNPLSLSRLFSKFIHSAKIPLETDRDAINQVLGVLETRLMDFEEVYILSFNEGIWPSKSLPGSLIPFSMRKLFGLPTAENRDAMYAYYFYRLIQRAGVLKVFYLTGHLDDSARSGEKSRYITQLMFELSDRIEVRPEPPVSVSGEVPPIIIHKTEAVLDKLSRYLDNHPDAKSLSASSLNDYLDCPLKFAFSRVYDFREPDEITNASEPKGFGTLIHQVMNRLYLDCIGKEASIDGNWLDRLIRDKAYLEQEILEAYSPAQYDPQVSRPGGKELLALKVVHQFIQRILEYDRLQLPLRIRDLERTILMDFPVRIAGKIRTVNLKGIIDRVDQNAEGIRIIDYKTGNIELAIKALDEVFSTEIKKRPKEVFQVLLYCEFYQSLGAVNQELIPCLYRLGKFMAGDGAQRIQIGGNDLVYSQVREEFLAGLTVLLQNIFDPELPFNQTEDEKKCEWCPYSEMCSR